MTVTSSEERIFKFPIPLRAYEYPALEMPSGSRIIHVGVQDEIVTVWAIVNPSNPVVVRRLYVLGTGQYVVDGAPHLGTVQVGPFVWHVFDGGES